MKNNHLHCFYFELLFKEFESMPSKAICILTLKSSLKLTSQLHLCMEKLYLWQRPDKTKTSISNQSTKHRTAVQNCLNAYFWHQLVAIRSN